VRASKRTLVVAAAVSAAIVVTAARDWAQNEANVQFHAFQDTRGVTVLTPTIDLTKDFTDRTGVRVKFGLDAITAASDGCARCHPEGARSARGAFSVSVLRKYGDTKVNVGGEFSRENFYTASTIMTSISRDLNAGNTTVAGGFSFSFNQPVLHPSQQTELQLVPDGYVAVTQTLTKSTIAQIGYEASHVGGYQTDPFLRTTVNGQLVLGQVPDSRTRQTVSARLRQALPADTYLEADYRRYHDSWAIDSNALTLGLSHHFTPGVIGGFSYRWYDQTGVYFYQPRYVGSPQFFTSDFRLIPFDSALYTGKLSITPAHGFLAMPEGSSLVFQYDRYRASTSFEAGIVTIGVRIPL
jgi:uncharacterized protein DUF3570